MTHTTCLLCGRRRVETVCGDQACPCVKRVGYAPTFSLDVPGVVYKSRCADCNGTGHEQIPCDADDVHCEFCGGWGYLREEVQPCGRAVAIGVAHHKPPPVLNEQEEPS